MNSKTTLKEKNANNYLTHTRNNKGITLIALVITIIVLLILAGVTISMVLGDDGIIAQAQSANKAQKNADEKDAIAVAIGEARTSEYLGVLSETEVGTKSKGTITFSAANPYNNSVRDIRKFTSSDGDEQYLPIPKGMAYAFGTIEEGAVVVDGDGNEFVWVPVDGTNVKLELDSEYEAGNDNTEPDVVTSYPWDGEAGADTNETNITAILDDDEYDTLLEQFTAEYGAMVQSVATYGGFYVGRYETSWTGSKVASVGNVMPMTAAQELASVGWECTKANPDDGEQSTTKATWYGLYAKQKELYEKNLSSSVVSGMIYGCQWDAIMNWMENSSDSNISGFVTNSTNMGNYSDSAIPTGSVPEYAVNNIYDLAGNMYEWTQEAYDSSRRVRRGGCYAYDDDSPASYREANYVPTFVSDYDSSRLQLYIK